MRSFLSLLLMFGLCVSAASQAPIQSESRKMLRFLKSGDSVGVQAVDGTTSVVISIYTQEKYKLAKAISERGRATTNAQEFAAENELVRKALGKYVLQHAGESLAEEELIVMPLIRTSLGTVAEIGDDYVLIELDDAAKRRCVYAKASIAKIYLDANPIRFYGPRRVPKPIGR